MSDPWKVKAEAGRVSTKKEQKNAATSALGIDAQGRRVLHDAQGGRRWITICEDDQSRYLLLDGCEQGAMSLQSEEPVFNYLWFHKCSHLLKRQVKRALVLGAGAFTAAKCLALDNPDAVIDAIDEEPELEAVGRRFFRLDEPAFAKINSHAETAEMFLVRARPLYEFIFDDLFDGFQHVPLAGRSVDHIQRLRQALAGGGVCVKNLIWSPLVADSRAACTEVEQAWVQIFPHTITVALGDISKGHNRMLIGWKDSELCRITSVKAQLIRSGIPNHVSRKSLALRRT